MEVLIGVVIGVVIGFAIGFVVACMSVLSLKVGVLQIDRSDPSEPPYPFLRISRDNSIEQLSQRKYVLLEVKNENFISQE
jgi:hypothetical protein